MERVFLNVGAIHNHNRNHFGKEKASKLNFRYRMLRGDIEDDN